nr:adenine-specific methyltransferase EcoRI family protein [Microbacterium testaceum]
MAKNSNLVAARAATADEFYTQLSDIECELKHYRKHFRGKTVYLNCDDPRLSNFFHYFSYNFEALGLKKLIAACYKSQAVDQFSAEDSEQAIWLEYEGDKNGSGVPDLNEVGVKNAPASYVSACALSRDCPRRMCLNRMSHARARPPQPLLPRTHALRGTYT